MISVPSGHSYVRTVTAAPEITVLPDPRPIGAPAGQWWPPVVLEPDWIGAHQAEADLLHIHFGTESFSPEHLRDCLLAARAAGWPVVFTVHDLDHPQLRDQSAYTEQLDVLIPGADAVITLTDGAAAEIERRWRRTATVVPHPSMLTTAVEAPPRSSDAARIGMHLKDLRSNVEPEATLREFAAALSLLSRHGRAVTGEVRLHRSVRDLATRDALRQICAESPELELIEHDRLDDTQLAQALAGLDAYVLPYSHGTHSGWLELCWDLAVPVAVPSIGYYADQHHDDTISSFDIGPSGESMAHALSTALDSPAATRAGTAERLRQVDDRRDSRRTSDRAAAETHAALYRALLDRVAS